MKALVASALVKLVTRCPAEFERIHKMLRLFECSLDVDLQQRACEFLEIMGEDWEATRSGILDRMPIVMEEVASKRPIGDVSMRSRSPPARIRKEAAPVCTPASPVSHDLIDLLGELVEPAAPSQVQPDLPNLLPTTAAPVGELLETAAPSKVQQDLPDLLPDTAVPVSSSLDSLNFSSTVEPLESVLPQPQEIRAFEKDGLQIHFLCKLEPGNGSATLTARFRNLKEVPLTDVFLEAAVPKYVQLTMNPATSNKILPHASGAETVTQMMSVVNLNHGQKPLMMKLRISYAVNGATVQEMVQVGNFPFNL